MLDSTTPVTLFTGQRADLPLEDVARIAAQWGYDGLEIAASGDHLDLERADTDDNYLRSRKEILDRHGLQVFAISNHLTGQAVCDDPIDFRHKAIVRPSLGETATRWGAPARCRRHEAVRARGPQTLRRRGRGVHRIEDLARRRTVPTRAGLRIRRPPGPFRRNVVLAV